MAEEWEVGTPSYCEDEMMVAEDYDVMEDEGDMMQVEEDFMQGDGVCGKFYYSNDDEIDEGHESFYVTVSEDESVNLEECSEESVVQKDEWCKHSSDVVVYAIDCLQDIYSLDWMDLEVKDLMSCHFASLDLAYEFYNWFARGKGFSARKGKLYRNARGEVMQQTFYCHRQGFREDKWLMMANRKHVARPETRCGCQALMCVHIFGHFDRWKIKKFVDEHNHELVEGIHCGMLPGHRRMSFTDVLQLNTLRKVGIGASNIFSSFAMQSGGYDRVLFGKKNLYNQIDKQRRCEGSDASSALQYLRGLTLNDPLMFVSHTVDDDGRLQHLFWCDGTSQLDYAVFGDVLAFDATYGKNKYKCPVVIFSSVNNHNKTIVFASAIVSNETEQTYVWLLEQLMEVMKGKATTSVITNGDMAMRNAINIVFPKSHHRLCAWHLLRNARSNVGSQAFLSEFGKCMLGDYDIGQFKKKWTAMVSKLGLEDNNWVNEMYDRRHMWAAAYIRGSFFAGFRTTSRCEGLHSLLLKFVGSGYNLTEFCQHFQRCLSYMRYKQLEADFACKVGTIVPQTKFPEIETFAARVMTREILVLFCQVLNMAPRFKVVDCRNTAGQFIYKVMKYKVTTMEWHVSHYPTNDLFVCSCQRMESFGIPCAHIIVVLVYLNIDELPNCLLLSRWTNGAKDAHEGQITSGTNFWDSHIVGRYVWLLESCREWCSLASQSAEEYNRVRQTIDNEINKLKTKIATGMPSNRHQIQGSIANPATTTRKGRGGVCNDPSSSGLKTKRTKKCGACRVPGHNKRNCPLLSSTEDQDDVFANENLNGEN